MLSLNSAPRFAVQARDLFAAMLHTNDVLPLCAVIAFEAAVAPPQPLGPPEGCICWPLSVHECAENYHGYQRGHNMRERMKYGDMPDKNAPLRDYVLKRLSHARAVWSADVDTQRTRLQFDDWLPLHLNFQTLVKPLWPADNKGPSDGWALSFQFLRLACDLPRFHAATSSAA